MCRHRRRRRRRRCHRRTGPLLLSTITSTTTNVHYARIWDVNTTRQPIEVLSFFVAIMTYLFWVLVQDATFVRNILADPSRGLDSRNHSGLKGDWGFYALVPALLGICLMLPGMPDIQELELGKTISKDKDTVEMTLQSSHGDGHKSADIEEVDP